MNKKERKENYYKIINLFMQKNYEEAREAFFMMAACDVGIYVITHSKGKEE